MASKKRRETIEHLKYRAFAEETIGKAMDVFKLLPEGKPKQEMRELLRHYLYNNSYSCVITPERPISPEYKLVIRDDCNGDIYAVDRDYLSFHYRYALKNAGLQNYNSEEYVKALKKNKAWNDMREFPTYRSVESAMMERLKEQQLPPNLIKAMQINDFRDFVRNNCNREFTAYREKKSFIKTFINAREEEFRTMLDKAGVDERYTDALIEKMYKSGEAWDVVVYDEKGVRIEGPEFDRHHTIPVYSPNNVASLSEVNSFGKLCLIEKNYHRWLHRLEMAKVSDDMLYFEKIMVPGNAACILDFETCILHDFNHPQRKLSLKKQAQGNLVYLNKLAQLTIRYGKQLSAQQQKNGDKNAGKVQKASAKYSKGGNFRN